MPFWWNRRNRWYRPRWKRRYTRYKKRKRPIYRRRRRYPTRRRRRRRRRRHKVRRKKQTLPVRQWQPDSIVKCKIKGYGALVLGAQGRQFICYTNVKDAWTAAKAPAGGGFGVEQFSLGFLYQQYVFRQCIWTKTNIFKDLCRYLWVKFTFYRHLKTDFVVAYERMPPFNLTKLTYPSAHPLNLLLSKHKKVILSAQTNPRGRVKHIMKIKPPKQMLNKWFFTEYFSKVPLLLLKGAACSLAYPRLGCCNQSQLVSFTALNLAFYTKGDWGTSQSTTGYLPYTNAPHQFTGKIANGQTKNITIKEGHDGAISWDGGYFQSTLLKIVEFTGTTHQASIPLKAARYNPNRDNGKGNQIWLKSTLVENYNIPKTDDILVFENYPLYLMLYGWLNYVTAKKNDKKFLESYVLCIKSPAIEPYGGIGTQNLYVPIDLTFVNGEAPYKEVLTNSMKIRWYPTIYNQMETINSIVESGPFIPRYDYDRESTWELPYSYTFYFKWGGPQITEQAVADPETQGKYDVPDTVDQNVQIRNPEKQKASTLFHAWDWRRGFITPAALKRVSSDISTDTTFQPDTTPPKKKKKVTGPALQDQDQEVQEIQSCLQCLYEEDTFQEEETRSLQQLIKQQQEQQNKLKYNILKLLTELKCKQRMLQLQTGILE